MPKVLVIEDEPENQLVIRMILETEGFEVVPVEDGHQGFDAARIEQPDLILLDVMMPDINGFDVFRQLRHSADTQHIPVIMLTALAQRWDVERAVRVGVDDYVIKPFEPDDLLASIRAALRRCQNGGHQP
ncbi:MAG: response regulator transcription factor [Abditibacteriales bacterium]|nr:response regulator transcription factor [Abditibacteriales bacterium]MDW8364815.1 response regulator transcription factor [Abditibacteriales bacterium]